jgi:hypothetical protein
VASRPIEYYQNLITSEHRDKPNFVNYLTSNLGSYSDTSDIIDRLDAYFDIDNVSEYPYLDFFPGYVVGYTSGKFIASTDGAQLDILGELIGIGRVVNFNPTDGSSPILSDLNYKMVLKAQILKNNWNGRLDDLVKIWEILFPGSLFIVTDNQDMSMTVILAGAFTPMIQDLIMHGYIVPKPEGVRINYSFGHLPVFGYDLNDSYVTGYDTGWWADYS